jgi:hypothetical protein
MFGSNVTNCLSTKSPFLRLFSIQVGVGDLVTNFVVVLMLLSVLVAIYQDCGFALHFFLFPKPSTNFM